MINLTFQIELAPKKGLSIASAVDKTDSAGPEEDYAAQVMGEGVKAAMEWLQAHAAKKGSMVAGGPEIMDLVKQRLEARGLQFKGSALEKATKAAVGDVPPDPNAPKLIGEMFAFISRDDKGDEGLTGARTPVGWVALVGADMARVEDIKAKALPALLKAGQSIVLARFSVRDDLEFFEPDGSHTAAA